MKTPLHQKIRCNKRFWEISKADFEGRFGESGIHTASREWSGDRWANIAALQFAMLYN